MVAGGVDSEEREDIPARWRVIAEVGEEVVLVQEQRVGPVATPALEAVGDWWARGVRQAPGEVVVEVEK